MVAVRRDAGLSGIGGAAAAITGQTDSVSAPLPMRARGTLWLRLVGLALAAVLPMLAITGFLLYQAYVQRREALEAVVLERAAVLAREIDREAQRIITLVRILATPVASRDDVAQRLRARLDDVVRERPDLTASVVRDADEAANEVQNAAAEPSFSSLSTPDDPTAPVLRIVIPVSEPDGVRLRVTVGVRPRQFQRIVAREQRTPGWVVAIADANDLTVARSEASAAFTGKPIPPAVAKALARDGRGLVHARGMSGTPSTIAYVRAPLTGFAAGISIPDAEFERPLRVAILQLGAATLTAIAGAFGFAMLLARRISRSLRRFADDVASGACPSTGFNEIDRLAAALHAVSRERDATIARLAGAEDRMRQILDALPVGVFVADERGEVVLGNRRGAADFSDGAFATPEERDRTAHPDDLEALHNWRRRWISGESPPSLELRHRSAAEYRWYLLSVSRVRLGSDGRVWNILVTRDIQARHEWRAALMASNTVLERRVAERTRELSETAEALTAELSRREQMQAALAQAQKREALGRLTGGVAHDVNNVLGVIINTYAAIELASGDAAVHEQVAAGRAAAEHSAGLLRYLTSVARQTPRAAALVETAAEVRDVAALCRHLLRAGITLTVDLADDLPTIHIDREMFTASMLNLVTNAREAMAAGGTITISARRAAAPRDTASVAIAVCDEGCGMTEDQIVRATEPFFTTKDHHGGSGLGLTTVDGFVTQSGGRLLIQSALGRGTTVTMFLPLATPDIGRPEPVRAPDTRAGVASGQTLLIVDDNAALLRSTALLLRSWDYAVLEAPDARTAYAIVAERPDIAAVVSDIVMPQETGIELAARLARLRPALPVIFVTGFVEDDTAAAGYTVLRKPVDVRALLAALADADPRLARDAGRGRSRGAAHGEAAHGEAAQVADVQVAAG